MFSMSQDRLEEARRTFDAALTTLTNARAYGTEAHAAAAAHALTDAAEIYADALRRHTSLVIDYAAERSS